MPIGLSHCRIDVSEDNLSFFRNLFRRITSGKPGLVAIKKIVDRLTHNVLRSLFGPPVVNFTLSLFKRRQQRRSDFLEPIDIGFFQIRFLEEIE